MILGLRTAIYPVADLVAARDWYRRVLDADPYFDPPFYVGLEPDGQPGTGGPQPLWGVADAAAALARLLELGAQPLDAVAEVGEGIKVAAVRDPFGNRFGFIENPHFDPQAVR